MLASAVPLRPDFIAPAHERQGGTGAYGVVVCPDAASGVIFCIGHAPGVGTRTGLTGKRKYGIA